MPSSFLACLALLPICILAQTPVPAVAPVGIHINCGGPAIPGVNGDFQADAYFTGGTGCAMNPGGTACTNSPSVVALGSSVRYGSFAYRIPAAPGNYTVTLWFSEVTTGVSTGQRTFDVLIDSVKYLGAFDIVAEASNVDTLISKRFQVNHYQTGPLEIQFITISRNAMVSGIEVVPIPDATATAAPVPGPTGYSPRWIVGTGTPAAQTGNDGDMYLRSDTADVIGPRASGTWPSAPAANIRGLPGANGKDGLSIAGPAGSNGKDAVLPSGNVGDVLTLTALGWVAQAPAVSTSSASSLPDLSTLIQIGPGLMYAPPPAGGFMIQVDSGSVPMWVFPPAQITAACMPRTFSLDDSWLYWCVPGEPLPGTVNTPLLTGHWRQIHF